MREKKIIKIGKVNENFGWMRNMGKREIISLLSDKTPI